MGVAFHWNRSRAQAPNASNFGCWHLVALRQIRDERFVNPPAFLLCNRYAGHLPVNRGVLDRDYQLTSSSDRKTLDETVRNLLRYSGGVYHRKRTFLLDAALPAAWWRVEISDAAAQTDCGLDDQQIYDALQPAWRQWADEAAYSSTRLAAPNTAAAYALLAHSRQESAGDMPRGSAAEEIILKLMRRTLQLSVSHISPKDLAALVA